MSDDEKIKDIKIICACGKEIKAMTLDEVDCLIDGLMDAGNKAIKDATDKERARIVGIIKERIKEIEPKIRKLSEFDAGGIWELEDLLSEITKAEIESKTE